MTRPEYILKCVKECKNKIQTKNYIFKYMNPGNIVDIIKISKSKVSNNIQYYNVLIYLGDGYKGNLENIHEDMSIIDIVEYHSTITYKIMSINELEEYHKNLKLYSDDNEIKDIVNIAENTINKLTNRCTVYKDGKYLDYDIKPKDDICSRCGKELTEFDYIVGKGVDGSKHILPHCKTNYVSGYGSKYDTSRFEFILCTDCADKLVEFIINANTNE